MKYRLFILSSAIVIMTSWCSKISFSVGENLRTISEETSSSIIKDKHLSWIPKDYTGDIALVTKDNSEETITRTGEQLLYRNEVFWFQTLFTKIWSGGHITKHRHNNRDYISISPMSTNKNESEWGWVIAFWIFKKTDYESLRNDRDEILGLEWLHKNTLSKNNEYYFILSPSNASHIELKQALPLLECKEMKRRYWNKNDWDCGIKWTEQLFTGFSTFNL